MGSSPRLRGTRVQARQGRARHGIIPALAGNTSECDFLSTLFWDHPRACGEHARSADAPSTWMGSSPRLRGTRAGDGVGDLVPGIIPALAGNTAGDVRATAAATDHPRACGEHAMSCVQVTKSMGSSPRLRGTQGRRGVDCNHTGIIPALAGNTHAQCNCQIVPRDHPRACGEHHMGLSRAY